VRSTPSIERIPALERIPVVRRGASRRTLRSIAAALAAIALLVVSLPLLVVWLPIVLVSRLVRAVHDRMEPDATPWNELIEFDPELGWRTAANLDTAARADSVFRFTTDRDGWRATREFSDCDIVVLGDSFAFGFGVDDDAHFANATLRGTRQPAVKAVGAVAYNLVQEYLLLERHAEQLAGKTVVWLIYVANDISENVKPHLGKYRVPFLRALGDADDWAIVTSHLKAEPWPWYTGDAHEVNAHAQLCCDTRDARRAYSSTRYLLRRARDLCAQHDAALVVMGVPDPWDFDTAALRAYAPDPSSFDPDRPTRELTALCEGLDVRFVDLRQHLDRSHYKATDNHWNEAGHQRVAEVIGSIAAARSGGSRTR
jgi:hypothetical protein